ncbi:MAG: B12-binding domain-containing radical SAM protein [Planctomycetota bacterium]|jgi:radical SAM superfamily enzyme YgiQ (UPF0313 family)
MKVLLVSPASKNEGHGFWDFQFTSFLRGSPVRVNPFLALPTLAALFPEDATVKIVDEYVSEIPFAEEWDLVGITSNTALAPRAYEIADRFRAKGCQVVLGGMHPSLLPDEAAEHADCVVIGEAEVAIPDLVSDWTMGSLKSRYTGAGYYDLSSPTNPRWDRVDLNAYSSVPIQTSRGCPYDCEFCTVKTFFGRKYRWKPIKAVVDEISTLLELGKNTLFFVDDNFLANRPRAMRLLAEVARLNVTFYSQVTLDLADDAELLEALASAGCKRVVIGLESLSNINLRQMKKGKIYRAETYSEKVRRIQNGGIEVQGSFMFGYDEDDPSVFQKTAEFIRETGMSIPILAIMTPHPGTDLCTRLEAENRILTRNWNLYDCTHVCFQPARMSPEELQEGYDWIRREVFSYDAIFERLESLWGSWNDKGLRHWDRISPLLVNLEAHSAAYGGPPFHESSVPKKAENR